MKLQSTFQQWSRDWYQNLNVFFKWLDIFSPFLIWFDVILTALKLQLKPKHLTKASFFA